MTVGSMLPFDRLVRAIDEWAGQHPGVQVKAQTGEGTYVPKHMAHDRMISPQAYRDACAWADVIVSHVGMGTVITAAELGKPLVALPRLPERQEVTSDHQRASAKWLRQRPGICVVDDERELGAAIEAASKNAGLQDFGMASRTRLIASVSEFLRAAVQ